MRVAVTGANGLLGRACCTAGLEFGHEIIPLTRNDWNLEVPGGIRSILERLRPEAVLHCAAATNVDWCQINRASALRLNADATEELAQAAHACGSQVLYVGSCGIFDGRKRSPYLESDVPSPLTGYAASKYEGEQRLRQVLPNALICRVGWLFGGERTQPKNFVEARRREAMLNPALASAVDKWGSPTWVRQAGVMFYSLLRLRATGLFHVANTGVASRHDYVSHILRCFGIEAEVKPVSSQHFQRPAPVPDYEGLASERLSHFGLEPLPDWRTAIRDYINSELSR